MDGRKKIKAETTRVYLRVWIYEENRTELQKN